jgi:2-oxoglutarate ferredoxin oxidoreductase subunit alpha
VAVEAARAKGKKISSLVLQTLWPVPEKPIRAAMKGIKKVIVPEMNMGQYLIEVERMAPPDVEVIGVSKMNTMLVSPQEIIQKGGLL